MTERRLEATCDALRHLAAHPDPASLSDGLSAPMAAFCLERACGAITREALAQALAQPGSAPTRAAVVAARGVFTAPLEWVSLLAAAGAEVLLKVPAAAPSFGQAVAEAFGLQGLPVEATTARDLPAVDALVAMGGDEAVASLASRHARARLSLHGHRFSLAVVRGSSDALARELALDALLYDGRGCFTPVAVLHTGTPAQASELRDRLALALPELARRLPPGPMDPMLGPEWRRRTGLARALGTLRPEASPSTALLDAGLFEAAALPGFLPVHPCAHDTLADLLGPWRPWLAACATDHEHSAPLLTMGFERLCRPGQLQLPPLLRPHGGREMLRPLMLHTSVEF
jgi:hypothetical protein